MTSGAWLAIAFRYDVYASNSRNCATSGSLTSSGSTKFGVWRSHGKMRASSERRPGWHLRVR